MPVPYIQYVWLPVPCIRRSVHSGVRTPHDARMMPGEESAWQRTLALNSDDRCSHPLPPRSLSADESISSRLHAIGQSGMVQCTTVASCLNVVDMCPHRYQAIIDTGDATASLQTAKSFGLRIEYLLQTHAHIDHIAGLAEIKESLLPNAPIHLHPLDLPW
jgi:hypothetical protein